MPTHKTITVEYLRLDVESTINNYTIACKQKCGTRSATTTDPLHGQILTFICSIRIHPGMKNLCHACKDHFWYPTYTISALLDIIDLTFSILTPGLDTTCRSNMTMYRTRRTDHSPSSCLRTHGAYCTRTYSNCAASLRRPWLVHPGYFMRESILSSGRPLC